jgi:hypothetical protein
MMTGSPQLRKLGQGRSSTTFVNRDCVVALGIGQVIACSLLRGKSFPQNKLGGTATMLQTTSMTIRLTKSEMIV